MKENKMGVMPIPELILKMSGPAILAMMVQAMYNIVDSLFVARIGEKALTAVSLAFPIQLILIACFVGLSIGINSSISRKLGSKNYEDAVNTAEHGYLLAGILYIFVALIGLFLVDDFFRFFTNDPEIINQGVSYARIVLLFSFGRIFAQAGMSILQGSGEMVKPMQAQLLGAITNIILDPILIFGWFGFDAMGVKGAAIATVTAQFISMVFVFFTIFKGKNYLKLDLRNFKFSGKIIRGILLVGLPAAIMQGLVAVMLTGLNKILSNYDDTAVAVLGVYYKLQSFVFMPVFGISQGTMPVIGYNYGAKNRERIKGALKFAGMMALGYMTLGMVIFQLFTPQLLAGFKATEEMMQIGTIAFRTISIMFPFTAINIVLSTAFQGMGKAHFSMIISILRQLVFLLPGAIILGNLFGLDQLWLTFVISEIAGLIIALYFYRVTYSQMNGWTS